jgi:hypothetical protein
MRVPHERFNIDDLIAMVKGGIQAGHGLRLWLMRFGISLP